LGGQKRGFAPHPNYWGRVPGLPPESTPMRTCICTHSVDPSLIGLLTSSGEFQGLRLAVVPDSEVPEARHGQFLGHCQNWFCQFM